MNEPEVIAALLRTPHTLAVIGLSDNPSKPSFYVSAYMQQHGFRILPVNPALETVLGERAFPSLAAALLAASLPTASTATPVIVNVFRLPKFIPAIVDQMIALGLRDLWIQHGIVDLPSAARAEAAGIRVVMDRCIMVEHRHLLAARSAQALDSSSST